VLGGKMTGTGLGLFSTSKYRLVTPSSTFVLDEVSRGFIPMGGLAYHLAKGCEEGISFARYLALSQREISGFDLYQLGVATHVTEHQPQEALTYALAHTTAPFSGSKYMQDNNIDISAMDDLLDTLHIESDVDAFKEEVWDKVLLVSPSEAGEEYEDALDDDDIAVISDDVSKVFSADASIEDCLSRLRRVDAPWARAALRGMASMSEPRALRAWFQLTAYTRGKSLNDVLNAEVALNRHLMDLKKAGDTSDDVDSIESLLRKYK